MTTINDVYISALLADACYVVKGLMPGPTGKNLTNALTNRMTEPLVTTWPGW
jgi:hypothetical protein